MNTLDVAIAVWPMLPREVEFVSELRSLAGVKFKVLWAIQRTGYWDIFLCLLTYFLIFCFSCILNKGFYITYM